jgi:transcriptional regulator with XRE-family HTH domain
MPASDGDSGDEFGGLILQLRGRLGLTQRELAARVDVHHHSVQAWEAGTSYPGVASLRALIATALHPGGFMPGNEVAEASALWSAAMRASPRLRTPFDRGWFDSLLSTARIRKRPETAIETGATAVSAERAVETRRHSWGEAPDVAGFVGRSEERERLRRWILDDRCRVVGVVGMAGIGKTLLAARLAHDVARVAI